MGRVKQRGLTLIELMVTLVIMAFLLLVGISLGGDWVNGARTQQARSDLEQGWGVAKALALRNPCQSIGEDVPAATLTMEHVTGKGYQLRVDAKSRNSSLQEDAAASDCSFIASRPVRDDGTRLPVWSASLPAGIKVIYKDTFVAEGELHTWRITNRGLSSEIASLMVQRGGTQNDETIRW
ncbi:prepilin-type N-terminal cleavage/methylation domain-containing protein [Comamonas aquatica]|uniref:pilus assembly FimT family protein n=1 Tax=Comamonas aquatica TaxID=225991 RepID=UPI00244AAC29|nr:prepilin-type N-terminal cleavage/methylation domain-containing protein [Comamonas aquatica]MDH1767668.1 prepilin-type N-terminal cleavage/methylation domain-containing protein [Comamonas aquatica]